MGNKDSIQPGSLSGSLLTTNILAGSQNLRQTMIELRKRQYS